MKVEKIHKKGSNYKIMLDSGEEINTSGEVILKNNLLYAKEIDQNLLNKIQNDTIYYQSYNNIVKLISQRYRSEFEVRNYLKEKGVKKEDSEKIVDALKNINLINDQRFAKAFVNDKINLTMAGPYKIKKSLELHNIDQNEITNLINSIPKEIIDDRIDKLLSKKVQSNKKYSKYILTQKITSYLVNLGYDKADIEKHLYKIEVDKTDMVKEMDKIYKSFEKKYTGNILKQKLKEKLYRRGFKLNEIEEYLNEKTF